MADSMVEKPLNDGLHDHQGYVVARVSNADVDMIVVLITTINLLLNAYRSYHVPGMPAHFCVDMAYRLMHEGHGHMNIGTVSIDGKFHVIAQVITSHEDTKAHQFAFRNIKIELARIVGEKIINGGRID